MSKYIIFILVFNVLCFAQDFDINEISDRKPVDTTDKLIVKRQLIGPQRQEVQENKENGDKNLPDSSQKVLPIAPEKVNSDSVKKQLKPNENQNPAAVTLTNSNLTTNNEKNDQNKVNDTLTKKEDTLTKKEEEKPKDVITKTDSQDSKSSPQDGDKKDVPGVTEAKNSSSTSEPIVKNPKHAIEHPGAALRGFYVFLGLSILIIIYFIFKAFRLRPGAPPPATVRKYGIVGRRSDMEMLPLPLAEEEDDDTLFDMGTQINR